MPLTRLLPWLLTAIAASVAGIISGAHASLPILSGVAALLFALTLIATSLEINRPWWELAPHEIDAETAASTVIRNTRLMALAYVWGALAMLLAYRLSGVRWQHGWQYGAAMALVSTLLLLYVHRLAPLGSWLRRPRPLAFAMHLNGLHGLLAVAGLAFLFLSGKFLSIRGDWVANQIFIAGGIAVTGLSIIALVTYKQVSRHAVPGANAGARVSRW